MVAVAITRTDLTAMPDPDPHRGFRPVALPDLPGQGPAPLALVMDVVGQLSGFEHRLDPGQSQAAPARTQEPVLPRVSNASTAWLSCVAASLT